MRNPNCSNRLWRPIGSDYPADMRKSIPDQEMWPSDLFAVTASACAPPIIISWSSLSCLARREGRQTAPSGVDPAEGQTGESQCELPTIDDRWGGRSIDQPNSGMVAALTSTG